MTVKQLKDVLEQFDDSYPLKIQVQYQQETPTGIIEDKWDELDLDNAEVLGTDKESTFVSIPLNSII